MTLLASDHGSRLAPAPSRLRQVNSVGPDAGSADKDSGSYGQVIFDFAPATELSVGGAERRQQQRDWQACPSPITTTSRQALSLLNYWPLSGVGSVKEASGWRRVAMVIVRDPDTNDRVSCAVYDGSGGQQLRAPFLSWCRRRALGAENGGSVNVWTYYLATKLRLDREQTRSSASASSARTPPVCLPPPTATASTSRTSTTIRPSFSEPSNSMPWRRIRAETNRPINRLPNDADEGVNAKLNFSLDAAATEPEAGATFSVDAVSGLVDSAANARPRERRSEYLLKVRVSDNGEPARSVTVDVAIAVLDINDHAPEFESCSSIQLRLLENRPPPALVGRLTARDADWSNNGNGRVQYRLEKSAESSAFDIDRQTGEIRAVAALDASSSHYSFPFASWREDQPQQRGLQLTGTCHVTSLWTTVNDNAPSLRIDPPSFQPSLLSINWSPDTGSACVYELLNSSDQRFGVHFGHGQHPDCGRRCLQRRRLQLDKMADRRNVNNYGNGSLLAFSNESVIICLGGQAAAAGLLVPPAELAPSKLGGWRLKSDDYGAYSSALSSCSTSSRCFSLTNSKHRELRRRQQQLHAMQAESSI
uniref:Cadherin domain-containing protein n=1 Tax=Macrostomum lignano TaxID=282301 RepID=A0A1I8FQN5_9PLAT